MRLATVTVVNSPRERGGGDSGHQVGVAGVVADEAGRVRTDRSNGQTSAADVVEHAPHQPIGHPAAPHGGVGLDVGHHDRGAVEVVVGDRHDAAVDRELVAPATGIVANLVLDLVVLGHPCSLAGRMRGNVNGSAARTP